MNSVGISRKLAIVGVGGLAVVVLAAQAAAAATPGALLWSARYDASRGVDVAASTAVTPDGKIAVVTGVATKNGKNDFVTIAYDPTANGAKKWTATYNGPTNGSDTARAVAASPGNDVVVVTGRSEDGASATPTMTTIGYDAHTGKQKWVARFAGPFGADPSALAISADNSFVVVTGVANGSTASDHADATVAYDLHTGALRWVRTNSAAHLKEATRSVAITPDSSKVIVVGDIQSATRGVNFLAMELNASNGAKKWDRRYTTTGAHDDAASAVTVSKDGATVFVAGQVGNAGVDVMTLAYDTTTGKQKWNQRYAGAGADTARAITMTGDGAAVVVAGRTEGTGTNDALTLAYDAVAGTQLWAKTVTGTSAAQDGANAVAATADGSAVVVAGITGNAGLIVSYDAHTGDQRWLNQYQRVTTAGAQVTWYWSVSVTPNGTSAIAAGQSQNPTTNFDYETDAFAV